VFGDGGGIGSLEGFEVEADQKPDGVEAGIPVDQVGQAGQDFSHKETAEVAVFGRGHFVAGHPVFFATVGPAVDHREQPVQFPAER